MKYFNSTLNKALENFVIVNNLNALDVSTFWFQDGPVIARITTEWSPVVRRYFRDAQVVAIYHSELSSLEVALRKGEVQEDFKLLIVGLWGEDAIVKNDYARTPLYKYYSTKDLRAVVAAIKHWLR